MVTRFIEVMVLSSQEQVHVVPFSEALQELGTEVDAFDAFICEGLDQGRVDKCAAVNPEVFVGGKNHNNGMLPLLPGLAGELPQDGDGQRKGPGGVMGLVELQIRFIPQDIAVVEECVGLQDAPGIGKV